MKNTPKILRALRAPCFYLKFARKTPFCGFWSDDTTIKKLFLLFFPPPCWCRRAQRAEKIVFSLGFFFWNGLRSKIEPLENSKFLWISKVHTFATPDLAYIRPKKILVIIQTNHFKDLNRGFELSNFHENTMVFNVACYLLNLQIFLIFDWKIASKWYLRLRTWEYKPSGHFTHQF